MTSLPYRRARAAVIVVGIALLATGCGRPRRPDVVVVAAADETPVAVGTGTPIGEGAVAWPQTIGLLCYHADVLRERPDCVLSVGPQIEMSLRATLVFMIEDEAVVDIYCDSGPAAMRAVFDLIIASATEELAHQDPGADDVAVKLTQTFGVAAFLALIETQCPDRFADAAVVGLEVVIDYEL
jgi:hypothetical protein